MHDWEVDVVSRFFELYSQKVRYGGDDTICWVPSKRKTFAVRSNYWVLSTLVRSTCPWKSILKVRAPPKVAFFVWMAALGKILTLDNFR